MTLITGCGKIPAFQLFLPRALPSTHKAQTLLAGTYSMDKCFLNKFATQGNGTNIYSTGSLTFNRDGTGRNHADMSMDSDCSSTAVTYDFNLTYSVEHTYGDVQVLKVIQQMDPNDLTQTVTYHLLVKVVDTGMYTDMDYSDGKGGPYWDDPSGTELDEFLAAPEVLGQLIKRQ